MILLPELRERMLVCRPRLSKFFPLPQGRNFSFNVGWQKLSSTFLQTFFSPTESYARFARFQNSTRYNQLKNEKLHSCFKFTLGYLNFEYLPTSKIRQKKVNFLPNLNIEGDAYNEHLKIYREINYAISVSVYVLKKTPLLARNVTPSNRD